MTKELKSQTIQIILELCVGVKCSPETMWKTDVITLDDIYLNQPILRIQLYKVYTNMETLPQFMKADV